MLFLKKKKRQSKDREKRIYQRIEPEDVCLVEFRRRGQKKRKLAELRDISISGVRFSSSLHLREKDEAVLYFYFPKKFPGKRKMKLSATVVWVTKSSGSKRYRIACSLEHKKETTQEVIRQFIYWQDANP